MPGKKDILAKIKLGKPDLKAMPDIPDFNISVSVEEAFISAMEINHGKVIVMKSSEGIADIINSAYPGRELSVSTLEGVEGKIQDFDNNDYLRSIDVAIITGMLGVGENAAIWIPESNLPHRAVPFVCEHLIVVLKRDSLVGNMHEAYDKIDDLEGYGVFISGPSKTADIEQALVIGAHGPRSMTVLLK